MAPAGRALWARILAVYDLAEQETPILVAACTTQDVIARLETLVAVEGDTVAGSTGQTRIHPALTEARAQRLVLAKLLGSLSLPVDEVGPPRTARQVQASRAAQSKWDRVPSTTERRARRGVA